jgi:hypothetical protein
MLNISGFIEFFSSSTKKSDRGVMVTGCRALWTLNPFSVSSSVMLSGFVVGWRNLIATLYGLSSLSWKQ